MKDGILSREVEDLFGREDEFGIIELYSLGATRCRYDPDWKLIKSALISSDTKKTKNWS